MHEMIALYNRRKERYLICAVPRNEESEIQFVLRFIRPMGEKSGIVKNPVTIIYELQENNGDRVKKRVLLNRSS